MSNNKSDMNKLSLLLTHRTTVALLLIWLMQPLISVAEIKDELADKLPLMTRQLNRIEQVLGDGARSEPMFSNWGRQINEAKTLAENCLQTTDKQLIKLDQDLESLGQVARDEPLDVTRKRVELQNQKKNFEKRLSQCRLLVLRSDELLDSMATLQTQLITERLLDRGHSFPRLLQENWAQQDEWLSTSSTFLLDRSGLEQLSLSQWLIFFLLLGLAVAVGVSLRRKSRHWLQYYEADQSFSSSFLQGLAATLARYALRFSLGITIALFFLFTTYDTRPTPFIAIVAYSLPIYFLFVGIVHLFLIPHMPHKILLGLPEDIAKALARRLKVLLLLGFVGFLLFATILAQSLPEPAMLLARGIFAAIFILNAMWALWLLGRISYFARTRSIRLGLNVVMLGALVTEWIGYRNLSVAILRTVIGTMLALGLAVLLTKLLRETFDGIEHGRTAWHRRLRSAMSLKHRERVPGLIWIRIITNILLWTGFVLGVLRIWGLSDADMQVVYAYLIDGFKIGSLSIIPVRILLAVVTFAFLITLSGWFRSRLEHHWLPKTRMDRGTREAMVTMSGYIGIALAALITFGVAGVEFGNLAIIAGALSVGIGFGLQNIVNNFVSGLILLFERPIKTGDWIVAGTTEGYVKRIRIRSTQIQTFDRADVIVPNSELISSQVTNWMLYDTRGRVRVSIGVAYGSDTQKVKQILEQVAIEHPDVITSDETMMPRVLFLAFGDSSLNFELRCYIKNIDRRLQITSDLNFAIDAAFRQQGIEIPFPQRDLHVRDWPDNSRVPPAQTGAAKRGRAPEDDN